MCVYKVLQRFEVRIGLWMDEYGLRLAVRGLTGRIAIVKVEYALSRYITCVFYNNV